jgi:hypothetical protein
MKDAEETFSRGAVLSRIVEQFRALAAVIGKPYSAESWGVPNDDGPEKAVLRVFRSGDEEDALRVTARFDDAGAGRAGWRERLSVMIEWQGEVNEVAALGWSRILPDAGAGLDSSADHWQGRYAIGKVSQGLRADVLAALKLPAAPMTCLPVPRAREEFRAAAADPVEPDAGQARAKTAKPAAGPPPALRPEPDTGLLQMALGELATKGGLKAEDVFAGFIKAAASPAPLKQGDIAAYAQGAMLEVSIFFAAFLRHGSMRASDLGMEGGSLRNAVEKMKAAFFEQDEAVRWQVAREMVTGMRLYYAEALACRGVPEAEAKEMLKTVFGRDAAIANEAIAILAEPEPAKRGSSLARLLGRNARE